MSVPLSVLFAVIEYSSTSEDAATAYGRRVLVAQATMSHSFLSAAALRSLALQHHQPGAAKDGLSLRVLLTELALEKYSDAFAAANVDDEQLCAAAAGGVDAIDELITAVGLRGGSATKFRRRMRTVRDLDANGAPMPAKESAVAARQPTAKEGAAARQPKTTSVVGTQAAGASVLKRTNDGKFLISSQAHLAQLLASLQANGNGVLVVEFSARWCSSCKKFATAFDKLVKEFGSSTSFCVVDVDQAPELTT